MSSPQNFASIEPWMFRPAMADTWLAEYIARDAETLTKALQKSLSAAAPEDALSPFLNLVKTDSATTTTTAFTSTPTVSSLSGSDLDSAPKRQRVASGKISKRKSRASKRLQTTFITADPANFRQMVQQVTGVRFGAGSNESMAQVVKPEPHRAVGGASGGRYSSAGAGCLPTLDTSALLLDHHRQQQQQTVVGPISSENDGPEMNGLGPISFGQPIGRLDEDASFGSADLDFETFSSCFPTLESSWKVM